MWLSREALRRLMANLLLALRCQHYPAAGPPAAVTWGTPDGESVRSARVGHRGALVLFRAVAGRGGCAGQAHQVTLRRWWAGASRGA